MQKKIEVAVVFACGVLFVLLYGYLESSLYVRPINAPLPDVQSIKIAALALGLIAISWSVQMAKEARAARN